MDRGLPANVAPTMAGAVSVRAMGAFQSPVILLELPMRDSLRSMK